MNDFECDVLTNPQKVHKSALPIGRSSNILTKDYIDDTAIDI
jgi:hypothetical protein